MSTWQRWKGIMKCYPFEDSRLAKWKPPYIVQPKYDGVRCRAIKLENGEWFLLSSEENPIMSVPHINEGLKKMQPNCIELDGELYCHGMNFENIISRTSRTTNIHPDYASIRFHIFDIISDEPCGTRINKVYNNFRENSFLAPSPYWLCYDLNDIMTIYDFILEKGYEGIIVRNAFAPYERKRSTWVMKFKPKQEDTYEIIGFKEEISKDGVSKGSLGALVCLSGDGNTFDVGSGLNQSDRHSLWERRDNLRGLSVRVQYQHVTSGKKVPRFPVFVEVLG